MARILVIDDEAIVREPIAAALRAEGHLVVSAGDGDSAVALARANRPDLVLLDIRMPQRDGISVLRELRGSPITAKVPVLLLSGTTDKDLIVQAAKLGAQSFLLKSAFTLEGLLERVRRFTAENVPARSAVAETAEAAVPGAPAVKPSAPPLAAQKAAAPAKARAAAPGAAPRPPKLLTREATLERLEHVAGGKAMTGVVAQLISVANSPSADMSDVVRVIESDPMLAARVLQLANSASTGARGRIRNVEDAARNLGVRGIQNMAISIGLVGAFPPDERDGFNTMRCWQHSYAVAELLNLLTRAKNSEQESMNHLVGLCHDMGDILLRQHFAAEYEAIMQFAIQQRQPIHDVAFTALGVRQPELASRLLARIGLPAPVVHAIREFYERQVRGQSAGMSHGTQGLAFANLAAHGLLLAPSVHEVVRPITRTEWNQFSPEKPPPAFDPVVRRGDFLTATNILARLPAREEERLLLPAIVRRPLRVRYVRPAVFVEFDPLAFALALSCELSISAEVPAAEQWQELDALVLVGLRAGVAPIQPEELRKAAFRAGRPELPTLALTTMAGTGETSGTLQMRQCPIMLQELDAWLGSVKCTVMAAAAAR